LPNRTPYASRSSQRSTRYAARSETRALFPPRRPTDDVLRAWLAATRAPGWEARRAAFVAAAILPEYSPRAMRALRSDPGYLTPRLIRRLVWLSFWVKVAPFVGTRARSWMRGIRSRYRKSRLKSS